MQSGRDVLLRLWISVSLPYIGRHTLTVIICYNFVLLLYIPGTIFYFAYCSFFEFSNNYSRVKTSWLTGDWRTLKKSNLLESWVHEVRKLRTSTKLIAFTYQWYIICRHRRQSQPHQNLRSEKEDGWNDDNQLCLSCLHMSSLLSFKSPFRISL